MTIDWQVETEKIRQLALEEVGMNVVGFTSADDFTHIRQSLEEAEAEGRTTGFEHPVIEERLYPKDLLDGAASIIAFAMAYPNKPLYPKERNRGERRGQFARASWGEDYHSILHRAASDLVQALEERYPGIQTKTMVDTGELPDVAVAQRAGIGFIGRNGLIINEEFGSFIYLGEIITNLPLVPDAPKANACGDCTRCLDFCPTGALLGEGKMNAKVCISYLTQTKGYIPQAFRRQVGHQIYGCDICQQVCPYNQHVDSHYHAAMEPERDQVEPLLKPMLTLSNREFKEQFGHLAGAWRGKKPLQRNAILALANYRDRSAIPLLLEMIEKDPRPMIRGTAAYAVSIIERQFNPELLSFMEDRLRIEEAGPEADQETVVEFSQAVERIKKKRNKRQRKR
ncbi:MULTISPECIES: tRNA epoxyqueuosine(34) reductase QueG [Aerococcus]|nr:MULTISPECIES: tRNA epoxyqueuosine(34) reductase QueG [Aerococcus]MDK6369947.1 tRNA epoxyqueuosine(34) reductase QueG [Aerococcus sp. UMB9870]MDK6680579.1 tRNA epoxyqueuosine(34) reductase QueG [Aerococcus sp. UMB8608]MDK6687306.1 tRNA epoxyqueuosine(34) reductase QueG [Aerococcus sp. UMB8623]MDK6940529.1 tRNA epoxyqueuosine(34) reductase QueG [Aerococcus sp. UMB8487]